MITQDGTDFLQLVLADWLEENGYTELSAELRQEVEIGDMQATVDYHLNINIIPYQHSLVGDHSGQVLDQFSTTDMFATFHRSCVGCFVAIGGGINGVIGTNLYNVVGDKNDTQNGRFSRTF